MCLSPCGPANAICAGVAQQAASVKIRPVAFAVLTVYTISASVQRPLRKEDAIPLLPNLGEVAAQRIGHKTETRLIRRPHECRRVVHELPGEAGRRVAKVEPL